MGRVRAEIPRESTRAHKELGDFMARESQRTARSLGSTAAKAAPSIRGLGQRTRAQVAIGNQAHPYGAGAELGAFHNQPRRTKRGTIRGWNQFPARKIEGYIVGETVRSNLDEALDRYERLLSRLFAKAFPD